MAAKFEPKVAVELAPPKDDPISVEDLAKYDGESDEQSLLLGVIWCLLLSHVAQWQLVLVVISLPCL